MARWARRLAHVTMGWRPTQPNRTVFDGGSDDSDPFGSSLPPSNLR